MKRCHLWVLGLGGTSDGTWRQRPQRAQCGGLEFALRRFRTQVESEPRPATDNARIGMVVMRPRLWILHPSPVPRKASARLSEGRPKLSPLGSPEPRAMRKQTRRLGSGEAQIRLGVRRKTGRCAPTSTTSRVTLMVTVAGKHSHHYSPAIY